MKGWDLPRLQGAVLLQAVRDRGSCSSRVRVSVWLFSKAARIPRAATIVGLVLGMATSSAEISGTRLRCISAQHTASRNKVNIDMHMNHA